jgi:hypothetical protein
LSASETEVKPEEPHNPLQRSRTVINMPGIVISAPGKQKDSSLQPLDGANKEEEKVAENQMDKSMSPLPKSESENNMKSARSGSTIKEIEEHKNEESDSSSDESSSDDGISIPCH